MEAATASAPRQPVRPPAEPVRLREPGAFQSAMIEAWDMAAFASRAIVALPRVPRYTSEVFRQVAILVRGSTVIIFAMVTFIGMAAVTFAYFFLRSAGASDYTGLFTGIVMPRAAVPIMFGYVFSAKVGCGLVAEIGAMRINEEIDAFEVEGVNPMSYVVGTRLIAAVLFIPIAVAVALLGGDIGSLFQAVPVLHATSPGGFLHYHWSAQNLTDNLQALLNLGSMAVFIVIVSCFYGYRAAGGPAGVGAAVARSLLVNIVMVHVIATFWIFVFFGISAHLPIGG
jgi:phospholipid/cholesterol/gamma-HCH transport system permease protein